MALPLNQVLLKVEKALNDEIITDSGIKLYLDGSYSKEWNAAVTAKVAELPIKVNQKQKSIAEKISVGDEVAMSYQVISHLEFKSDSHRFMEVTEENPYFQEFANGKGEWIKCYALPARRGIAKAIWVGTYFDKRGQFIDGAQGTESDVQRWKSQFEYGKTDLYNHCNYFSYNGQDYWKADLNQIFAKKVDGHIIAVGDRIICKPIEEDVPANVKQSLNYNGDLKIRYQDRGRVISSTRNDIKKDYIISFQANHVEKYDLWGKQYFLIKERFVQGVWEKNNKKD